MLGVACDALISETQVTRLGLLTALSLWCKNIVLEGDYKDDLLKSNRIYYPSSIMGIINDYKVLATGFDEISFQWVRHLVNCAAHLHLLLMVSMLVLGHLGSPPLHG